jgi:hypothetical protein
MTAMPGSGVPETIPDAQLVGLDAARNRLTAVWLVGSGIILALVILQSLLGKYGDETQEAWGWLLPTLMPLLGMIISVLGYSALDARVSRFRARKSFYRIALWLSVVYLALVLLTILIQPEVGTDPIALMHTANLWLGPLQGLAASALGVLFVSTKPREKGDDQNATDIPS